MFPLRDENPTSRVTWMTWLLVGVNVAVFAYEIYLSYAGGNAAFEAFVSRWAFDPARLRGGARRPRPCGLTVLTAMFLHAGWLHVGGNMLYLWIFGNNVEDRLGPLAFLAFYLACGSSATVAQTVASGTGRHREPRRLRGGRRRARRLPAAVSRGRACSTAIFIVIFFELALRARVDRHHRCGSLLQLASGHREHSAPPRRREASRTSRTSEGSRRESC